MVVRKYFECNICSAITMVRTQADDSSYPVRFTCCNCNSSMKGKVTFLEEYMNVQIEFDNCTEVNTRNAEFYFEVSNALLTEKIRNIKEEDEYIFSPFMKNLGIIGHEEYSKNAQKLHQFSKMIDNEWSKIMNIVELYLNGKGEFITKQIHQYLPKHQFPCNNDLEKMRAVHSLALFNIARSLPSAFYDDTCKSIFSELSLLTKEQTSSYLDMVNYLESNDFLQNAERKILKIMNEYCVIFKNIEPVILLRLSGVNDLTSLVQKFGLSSSDFEDLKGFYLDTYEFLGDSLIINELHNNLKYRNDFKNFAGEKKVSTIDEYEKMSKGNRINFINKSEIFSNILNIELDNKLRNSIGHNNYDYNGLTQQIEFIDHRRPNKSTQLYLIDFALICYQNFISVINLAELIYQARKLKYVLKGQQPVHPSVFQNYGSKKKVGRNESCPCGSGLKYKKCCGKVT